MSLEFSCDWEVSPAGTAFSTANTGFDTVANTGTCVSDSDAGEGSFSSLHSVTGTQSTNWRKNYTARDTCGISVMGKMSAYPPAIATLLYIASNTTIRAQVRLNTDGTLQLRNGSTNNGAASSLALPLNSWWRINWKLDNVAGLQGWQMFVGSNVNGVTPDDQVYDRVYNTGTSNNSHVGTTSSVAGTWAIKLDRYRVDTVDWPAGPPVVSQDLMDLFPAFYGM